MRLIIALVAIGVGIGYVMPLLGNEQTVQHSIQNQNVAHSITHDEIVELTDEFMTTLVQDIDSNYKVKNYHNKDSLIKAFSDFTTEEVVRVYVDYYYTEEDDSLYIIPTETPPWFNKQNQYDVVQLEKNKVLVKQENKSELFADYGIDFEFTFANQKWKITKIIHL